MTDQQQFLLKLLKEIHEICIKHDIEYFLAGGTLIGALRHKGFLPWDDDADIYMTRSNWEKFVQACKTDLPANRALLSPETDLNYTNTFPRYISTDTTAIHTHQILNLGHEAAGEVIDILVLDPISDDEKDREEYTYNLMIYSDLLNPAGCFGRRFGVKARHFFCYLLLSKIRGKAYIQNYFQKKLAGYFSDTGKQYAMRWGGTPLFFDRSWFEKVQLREFEDFEAMCPVGANEYLVDHYGDEWSLVPSHAERSSHDAAFSDSVACEEALKNYTPSLSLNKLSRAVYRRKIWLLANANHDHKVQESQLIAQALKVKMELESKLERESYEFEDALRDKDFTFLSNFFADYFNWQLSARTIGRDDWNGIYRYNHPVLCHLDSEMMYTAVYTLFSTERIGKAFRLIEVIEKHGESSEKIRSLKKSILIFREAVNLYEKGSYDAAERHIATLFNEYGDNVSFLKLKTCLLFKNQNASFDSRQNFINRAMSLYPDDGFFQKYYADLLMSIGKKESALENYRSAIENTLNGFVLLDVKEKFGLVPQNQQLVIDKSNNVFEDIFDDNPSLDNKDDAGTEYAEIDEQKYLFSLLSELVNYCNEHDIQYILPPKTAYCISAYGVLPNRTTDFSILINSENYKKIIENIPILETDKRAVEYMGNNASFPTNSIHYVGLDSLYMPLSTTLNYRYKGLYVAVKLLESDEYPKAVERLHSIWKATASNCTRRPSVRHLIFFTLGKLIKLISPRYFAKLLLDKFLKYSDASMVKKISVNKESFLLPKEIFEDLSSLNFRDINFSIPKQFADYIEPCIAMDQSIFYKKMDFKADTIVSSSLSFADYLKRCELDKKFFMEKRISYLNNFYPRRVRKKFRELFQEIKDAVSFKDLMVQYLARKAEILDLYQEKDFDTLAKLFLPYKEAMKSFELNIYTPLDREIHNIFLATLVHQDERDLIESLNERGIPCV